MSQVTTNTFDRFTRWATSSSIDLDHCNISLLSWTHDYGANVVDEDNRPLVPYSEAEVKITCQFDQMPALMTRNFKRAFGELTDFIPYKNADPQIVGSIQLDKVDGGEPLKVSLTIHGAWQCDITRTCKAKIAPKLLEELTGRTELNDSYAA